MADEPDVIEILRDLIRFDTTNPPGNEKPAADYLARLLAKDGISSELVEPAPGRASVIARLKGGSEPPLLLSAHLDVVAAAGKWERPPFSGDLHRGYVWGRGAVDMKHMAAMSAAVLVGLKRSGAPLRRDVIFAGVADEEAGGAFGAGWIVENRPDLLKAGYCMTEVGGMATPMPKGIVVPVQVAERGFLWFRLKAKGPGGHGSTPRSASAVATLAAAVDRLSSKPLRYHLTPSARAFIKTVAAANGPAASAVLVGLLSSKTAPLALKMLPAERQNVFRAMLYDTAVVTVLSAGSKVNVVPEEAVAEVDGRYLPGVSPDPGVSREEFLSQIRSVVGPSVEILPFTEGPPTEMPGTGPLMDSIVRVLGRRLPGAKVTPYLMPGMTDAKHYAKLGMTVYGFAPVSLKPDEPFAALYHAPDERISVEGMRTGYSWLKEVVEDFCLEKA